MTMPESLRTERLVLRLLGPDDVGAVHALFSQPARTVGGGPVTDPADTRAWLARRVQRYQDQGLAWYGLWSLDGAFVGSCGLFTGDRCGEEPEIGYELDPLHRGRGFAREAARRISGAAHEAGHRRLWATIRPANVASVRLVQAIGYRFVQRAADEQGALDYFARSAGRVDPRDERRITTS